MDEGNMKKMNKALGVLRKLIKYIIGRAREVKDEDRRYVRIVRLGSLEWFSCHSLPSCRGLESPVQDLLRSRLLIASRVDS
ncbi:hypothetical protein Tco_0648728 [Tanacetum coccineum]